MKTISTKSIIKFIPIILFLLSHNLSYCQITYKPESDIILTNPDSETGEGDGFPVYNTEYNPTNRKLYFFNRLSTANTGFYVYDLNYGTQTFVETTKAIGDLVYNAEQNHILVSEYCPAVEQGATVKVFDANDISLIQTLTWANNNYDFPGKIFIAPNGKIYISMNMRADDNMPNIQIIGTGDYSNIDNKSAGLIGYPDRFCNTFQSFYCYNPFDDKVYATFGPFLSVDPPYQTASNSAQLPLIEPIESSITDAGGKLISFNSNNETEYYSIERPSEIICATPDSQIGNTDYKGTLFINAYYDLFIFNCDDNSIGVSDPRISNIYDMVYCPESSSLYAYDHEHISISGPDVDIIHIYKVQEDGSSVELWNESGYASSISYNKFDQQLYVYYLSNENLIGQVKTKLITLNPFADENAETGFVELPFKNLFPEIVPQANHPHFDAYNKAYFPNGAHSSVSMVGFSGMERLELISGTDWISIPRMVSNASTDWLESDFTINVLDRNNFETVYTELDVNHLRTQGIMQSDYLGHWDNITNEWLFDPNEDDNKNTFSYRGYQLDVIEDSKNYIEMYGNIKDPATQFPLYKDKKNWIGYFLTQKQDVFNALADHLEDINEIWHREYYCYRPNGGGIIFGPEGGGAVGPPTEPEWACSNSTHEIEYGDMIIVNPNKNLDGESNPLFFWSSGALTLQNEPRPETDYYSYTETSSYKPFIIELDSTANPQEIGAFVGDSCIGACSVIEADTAVILLAYIDVQLSDSIVFQEYTTTKSNSDNIINSYSVLNEEIGIFEKRSVSTKEGNQRAFISFKNKEVSDVNPSNIEGKIWPNPASDKLNYSFYSDVDGKLNISLFDINGKLVSILIDKAYQKGLVSDVVKLKGFSGSSLKSGIYFVKVKMGDSIITKKLVVQ